VGMIYKRGKTWWIKYYRNGKPYRESAKSHNEADAKRLLKRREGEISQGKLPGVLFDKVRFDELAEDLLRDYRINGKKSVRRAQKSVNHLTEAFEGLKVPNITTPRIQGYITEMANPLFFLVPEVGFEPTQAQGPEDFESSASTSFTTPAQSHRECKKGPIRCQQNNNSRLGQSATPFGIICWQP
jgi:hypothetical protein